ncbi:MAG: metallophosphoesterase family protein [Candidatus Theseobacter exili]|nr:metallophosphoesterase family protein [Candidatus Theseobacter exili]
MRIAVIADIHSNLEALEASVEDAVKYSVQKFICLGDIVGYAADPSACISRVREIADTVIAGNHDWAVTGKTNYANFNEMAKRAVEWTASEISFDDSSYLSSLKLSHYQENMLYVHASPVQPESWNYIWDIYDAIYAFERSESNITFIGHSHVPVAFSMFDGKVNYQLFPEIEIQQEKRYLINVGSVGQPRDNDPRASYVIYDIEKGSLL